MLRTQLRDDDERDWSIEGPTKDAGWRFLCDGGLTGVRINDTAIVLRAEILKTLKEKIRTTKLVSWLKLELKESFHELDAKPSLEDIREAAQRVLGSEVCLELAGGDPTKVKLLLTPPMPIPTTFEIDITELLPLIDEAKEKSMKCSSSCPAEERSLGNHTSRSR